MAFIYTLKYFFSQTTFRFLKIYNDGKLRKIIIVMLA